MGESRFAKRILIAIVQAPLSNAHVALAPLSQFVRDGQIQLLVDGVEDQAEGNGQERRSSYDGSDQANAKVPVRFSVGRLLDFFLYLSVPSV